MTLLLEILYKCILLNSTFILFQVLCFGALIYLTGDYKKLIKCIKRKRGRKE